MWAQSYIIGNERISYKMLKIRQRSENKELIERKSTWTLSSLSDVVLRRFRFLDPEQWGRDVSK